MQDITKSPRIFVSNGLSIGETISLDGAPHHYLKNVMRLEPNDKIRLFNGVDGEFVGIVKKSDKKAIDIDIAQCLKDQNTRTHKSALIFPPLKKEAMDILIEKSVELDVTDFYPIITQNTDVRKINEERLLAQMVEAAEQCERMDIPTLHPLMPITKLLGQWDRSKPIYAGIERLDALKLSLQKLNGDVSFLIGPAGGFTKDEKEWLLPQTFIHPVSLGANILRAETAAIAGLAFLNSQ